MGPWMAWLYPQVNRQGLKMRGMESELHCTSSEVTEWVRGEARREKRKT